MKSFTAKPVAPHVAERKAASKILAPKHRAVSLTCLLHAVLKEPSDSPLLVMPTVGLTLA